MTHVDVTRQGRVAYVTFQSPGPVNVLSLALMRELTEVARGFESDPETSAVVLSAKGENFCLGFDLKDAEFKALGQVSLAKRRVALQTGARMCQAWENVPALTVCAIEGWCVGGGVALAVSTDLRVIGANATLYIPEVERGLNMSWGSIPRITNLVGPARAKRLIVLAEQADATRSVDWGLADEIAAPTGALSAATAIAERAAALPPVAVRMTKAGIDAYATALAHTASWSDCDQFALALGSEDTTEAISAFLDKRPPTFTGR